MKQLILNPSILGITYMFLVELNDTCNVKTTRYDFGKGCTIETLIEKLRAWNLPIFVDPAYPEIVDALKRYGHWVLK